MYDGERFSNLKEVAVFRSLEGLGDFLCIVPALRSLRTALPQAKIVLVGLQKTQALVQRFHQYLDELLVFPGYPGLPEQLPQVQQLPAFLAAVQKQQFDLTIQMHGSGIITNPIAMLLGAKRNAGFVLPDQYCPDVKRFLPYPEHEPEVRRYLRLLSFLGITAQGEALEFPLQEADYQALKAVNATRNLCLGRYVCIHPGASVVERRWSLEKFAIVADAIAQHGFQIVLTGTSDEVPLTQAVARLMQTEALNLAGYTTLGALAVLLSGSRLLLCNDTGVSHLADALQVPSVVIFTASDPQRWAPLNRDRHRALWRATGVTAGDAIAQAEALLQQPIATASVAKSRLSEVG